MSASTMPKHKFYLLVLARVSSLIPTLMLAFFLPAGTFSYWQGWIYIILLATLTFLLIIYLLRHDPALVERRMRMKEKRTEQKLILKFSILFFTLTFLLPGFDRRWGWSKVPVWLVITASVFIFLSYTIIFLTMRENSYLGRTIEVDKDQQVISSGPYAIVRHPFYSGTILMFLATPLALGSWWALIPALLIIPTMIIRILDEEKALSSELLGYTEYLDKVKWRLVPGIW